MIWVCCTLFLSNGVWGKQFKPKPYVLLVSFDGFRADYIDRLNLPHFKKFRNEGSSSPFMIPSFPSLTFPNHYTLVTGLAPGHHGLVDNQFFNPQLSLDYAMSKKNRVSDSRFYGGTPIWTLARQQGLKTASYFWVGSEVMDSMLRPNYYFPYQGKTPNKERIDQVVRWFNLPEAQRPQLVTLYFSSPDHESHQHGPFGDTTLMAVKDMDNYLGYLMAEIKKISLPINIILVSDHGMRALPQKEETYIMYESLIPNLNPSFRVVSGSCLVHFYTQNNDQADSLHQVAKTYQQHFKSYRAPNFPSAWKYNHASAGDVLWVIDTGYCFRRGKPNITTSSYFGVHGYDPYIDKEMYAICMAWGPSIKSGYIGKPIHNTDVYVLVAKLLGLKPGKTDGSITHVKKWIQKK